MTNKPVKLVLLLQDLEYGGTQRYAVNLVRHLDRRLFTPEFWILRQGEHMLPLAKQQGVKVIYLSRGSVVGPRSLAHLARRLHCDPPEILYTLTVVPNIWGRLFAGMMRVPVVVSGYRSLMPKQHDRLLWRFNDGIITNCEACRSVLTGRHRVDPARIFVVPNGVDTDHFTPRNTSKSPAPSVVYAGRLVDDKDPLTLLEAFRLTVQKIPEARLTIIGDGHLKSRVDRFVYDHGLQSNVAVSPGVPDIRPHLRRAWVFALASRTEASPNVVLEAMATGLPVVATSVGGVPELIRHGENGLLVPPDDAMRFSEALARFLVNSAESEAMGDRAREITLTNYSLEKNTRLTEGALLAAAGRDNGTDFS